MAAILWEYPLSPKTWAVCMVDTSNEIAIQKSSKWACLRKRMGYPKSTGLSSFSAFKQSFWGLYTPFPDTPNYHSHWFCRGFSEGLPQQPQSMVIIIFEAQSALCSNVRNAEPNLRISCWVVHSGPMFRHHVTYFPYLFMVYLVFDVSCRPSIATSQVSLVSCG